MAKTTPRIQRRAGRKPPPETGGDPEQYQRFREFARQVEADENPETFDRTFRKVVRPKPT